MARIGLRILAWTVDFRGTQSFRQASGSGNNNPTATRTINYDRAGDVLPAQVFTLKSGLRYEGDTDASLTNPQGPPHGKGKMTWPEGRTYEGAFDQGKFAGYGVMTYPPEDPGIKYSGDWRDGNREGRGVMLFRDGGRYEGEFRAGKFHGYGRYFDPSGRLRYAGPYVDNRATGPNEVR